MSSEMISKTMHDILGEDDIKTLVYAFYDKVRKDERLDYIFSDFADVNWDTHLPKMIDFWSKLLFQTKRYKGKPFRHHLPLPVMKNDFALWYGYFEEAVDEHFGGEKADYAKEIAGKITSSFYIRLEMEGKFEDENEKVQQ
jgi:hemoglobin